MIGCENPPPPRARQPGPRSRRLGRLKRIGRGSGRLADSGKRIVVGGHGRRAGVDRRGKPEVFLRRLRLRLRLRRRLGQLGIDLFGPFPLPPAVTEHLAAGVDTVVGHPFVHLFLGDWAVLFAVFGLQVPLLVVGRFGGGRLLRCLWSCRFGRSRLTGSLCGGEWLFSGDRYPPPGT